MDPAFLMMQSQDIASNLGQLLQTTGSLLVFRVGLKDRNLGSFISQMVKNGLMVIKKIP